jgi:hypothetical protein
LPFSRLRLSKVFLPCFESITYSLRKMFKAM